MFIRVEKDILESAMTLQDNSIAIHVLMELSIAITRGKHYVYIPHWVLYRKRLTSVLPKTTLRILDGLKRQDGNALDKKIKRKIIVTDRKTIAVGKEAIIFSPSDDPSFEIFEETHLLCENINENNFYDKIEAFYRKYSVPQFSKNTRYNVLPRNGGGATSHSVLMTEKRLGNHLILIIADSDYKYCFTRLSNGKEIKDVGPKGDTASKLEEIQKKDPYKYGHVYIMEECREVENLIPRVYLRELHPNNVKEAVYLIDNYNFEYLDIKEGIRIVHMFNDEVLKYWEKAINDLKYNIQGIKNIKQRFGSKRKYQEYLKNCKDEERRENIIIDGWGNGILEDVLKHKGSDFANLKSSDLTPSQRKEWKKIGKNLFEWGLASYPLLR